MTVGLPTNDVHHSVGLCRDAGQRLYLTPIHHVIYQFIRSAPACIQNGTERQILVTLK